MRKLSETTAKNFKFTILLLGLITGLISHPSYIYGQVGITAVPFMEINNDARSLGMAGANVAMRGARSGIHLNPAAFGKPNTMEFTSQVNFNGHGGFFGTPWLSDYNNSGHNLLTPQFIAGFEKFSVAYQYTSLDFGEQINSGSISPDPINTFRSHERTHTISAAYHISPQVSVGAGVNFIKSDLAEGTIIIDGKETEFKAASRTAWDLGLYADHSFQQDRLTITPSFGWSITDMGEPMRYIDFGRPDPLPIVMRAGLGLEIETNEGENGLKALRVAGYLSRSKTMARLEDDGSPMGPFKAIFNSWGPYTRWTGAETVTLSLRDQLRKQHGLEITLFEFLSIRTGRFWEHRHNGNRKYNTLGFGVNYKYFNVDYAGINTDENNHPLEDQKFLQFTANIPLDVIERLLK